MAEEEGQKGQDNNPLDGEENKDHQDPLKKLGQDLFTRIGRVDAETKQGLGSLSQRFDRLETILANIAPAKPNVQPGAQDEINQKWAERILNGDVSGVLDEHLKLRETAKEMLTRRNKEKMSGIIQAMDTKELPFFKDVKATVEKAAEDLISKGYSPEDAVAFSYEKARADHLMNIHLGGHQANPDLNLQDGGRRRQDDGEAKGKLNAEGRAAWEREKNTMIGGKKAFKDEADWINHMAPAVKSRFVG